MPRQISSDMLAALRAPVLRPAFFVEIEFTSGTSYVWSGIGPIDWNGHTWQGVGWLGAIEFPSEDADVHANQMVLSLSGISSDILLQSLTECKQGKPVNVWMGAKDENGAIINSPILSACGRIDVPSIEEGAETSTIRLTVENKLVEFTTKRERRYTTEDQHLEYPTDKGFDFVPSLQNWNRKW